MLPDTSGNPRPTKVNMAQLWQKYGSKKKKLESVVREVQQQQQQQASTPTEPKEEGFMIRFELSRAYKAIEKQETEASRPAIKPHRKKRRHRRRHRPIVEQQTVPKQNDGAIQSGKLPAQDTRVSKMRGLHHEVSIGHPKEHSNHQKGQTTKKGHEEAMDATLPGVLEAPGPDYCDAVLEWERRNEVRRQYNRRRAEKIKSAPPAVGPNSKSPTSRPNSAFSKVTRSSNPVDDVSKGKPHKLTLFQRTVNTVEKINLLYPSKKATPVKPPTKEVAPIRNEKPKTIIRNPYDIIRQLGETNTSENRDLLHRDPYSREGANSLAMDGTLSQSSTRPNSGLTSINSRPNSGFRDRATRPNSRCGSARQQSRPVTPANIRSETPGKHSFGKSNGAGNNSRGTTVGFDLADTSDNPNKDQRSQQKPKLNHKDTKSGKCSAIDEEEEERSGQENLRLRICRYFYTMCNCQKATGSDTFSKIQKRRKVSAGIPNPAKPVYAIKFNKLQIPWGTPPVGSGWPSG